MDTHADPPTYEPFESSSMNQTQADSEKLEAPPFYDETDFLLPSSPGEAAYATESVLARGLQVRSRTRRFTSGFAYTSELAQYNVSEAEWNMFTQEVVAHAKLSPRQWSTTVGRGLGVLAVGSLAIGVFSTVPAFLLGRKIRLDTEHRNLTGNMAELSWTINEWNETFFRPRGVLVRVDLPCEMVDPVITAKEKESVKGLVVVIPLEEKR